jgi:hypothetical protein
MTDILKTIETIEKFHPINVIKENYKEVKDEDTKEDYNNNNCVSFYITKIYGIILFIISIYLWIVFHYDKPNENYFYKFITFIFAFLFNTVYILFNLIFDTGNTINILTFRQVPFTLPVTPTKSS